MKIPEEGISLYIERFNEAYEAMRAKCAVELPILVRRMDKILVVKTRDLGSNYKRATQMREVLSVDSRMRQEARDLGEIEMRPVSWEEVGLKIRPSDESRREQEATHTRAD